MVCRMVVLGGFRGILGGCKLGLMWGFSWFSRLECRGNFWLDRGLVFVMKCWCGWCLGVG